MAGLFDDLESGAKTGGIAGGGMFDDLLAPKAEGIVDTIKEGAKSTGRAVGAAVNTYTGNGQGIADKALTQQQAPRDERLEKFHTDYAERTAALGDDPGVLETIGQGIGAIADNPAGAGLAVVEQLPNAAVALGGGWAGMKAGAAAGGALGTAVGGIGAVPGAAAGSIVGGIAGMFLGNTALETGHKAMGLADDGEVTPEEMSQAKREGAIKGGVITGVDVLTLGIGGKVSSVMQRPTAAAMEAATRKVLVDQGVDVANEAAVLAATKNPAIATAVRTAQDNARKATDKLGKRAAVAGTLLTMETVGEGLGEYLGELAATGEGSVPDAVLESLLSLGQSGAETAWNIARTAPGRMIQPQPSAENPAPAPVPAPDPQAGAISRTAAMLPGPSIAGMLPAPDPVMFADGDGNVSNQGPARDVDREYRPTGRERGPQTFGPGMDQAAPRGKSAPLEGQLIRGGIGAQPQAGQREPGIYDNEPSLGLPAPSRAIPDMRADTITVAADGTAVPGKTATPTPTSYVQGGPGMDQQREVGKTYKGLPAANRAIRNAANPEQLEAVKVGPQTFEVRPKAAEPEAPRPVLQNRDRSTPASVTQMRGIAAKPDYQRVSISRDFANGAPVVEPGASVPASRKGRSEVVSTASGRKINAQYAVIEAADLLPSHDINGSQNADYESGALGKSRAIAGNGRVTGISHAYTQGTAGEYRRELEADAGGHGISPAAIKGMKNPVLVRIMPQDQITQDIGDESNTATVSALSGAEQARNDAKRIDAGSMAFDDNGEISEATVRQFIQAMPEAERSALLDGGRPSRQAYERAASAVFASAYESDELVRLQAQATDPEARTVLAGLLAAASKMARLKGQGQWDIRGLVVEAAQAAVNATRNGQTLAAYAQQLDIERNPEATYFIDLFAANSRSGKRIGEELSAVADTFYAEASKAEADMFGAVPRRSRQEILGELNGAAEGQPGSAQPTGQPAGPAAIEASGPAAAANDSEQASAGADAQAETFQLNQQTEEELAAADAANKARIKAEEKAQAEADEKQRKEEERAQIKAQSEAQADSFTLGANAEDSLSGQSGMFDSQPSLSELGGKPPAAKPAPKITRQQAITEAQGAATEVLSQGGTEADAIRAATDQLIERMADDPSISISSDAPAAVQAAKQDEAASTKVSPVIRTITAAGEPGPAIISELDAVIAEQKAIADDWESRTYKRNSTQVDLQGDGPRSQGSISVSGANEARRENAIRAANQAEKAARTLKLNLENDYQGAMAPLVRMRGKVETDADFEQQLLSDMGVRPPGGKGNVSTNSLSKAVLRGVKVEQAKAEQAKQAEQEQAADAERKRQDAEAVRQQAIADGVDEIEALFGATATTDTQAQRLREAMPDATLRSGDTASSNPRSPFKGKWAVFQGDSMLSSGWADTREAAVDGVLNKTEAWHTPLPEQGIALTKEQQADKDGAYRGVTALVAADAMDAVTQTQSINQQTMSLYYLPESGGMNGAARLIPDGQAMPDNWKKVDAPALSVGAMTREQAVRKITDLLANAAVVGSPAKAEVKAKSPAKIENFGEELQGKRKVMPKSLDAELTDEDIANQPLSKLWPPAEIDGMEDTFAAAVAMAARAEIPAKPRKGYKLNAWVGKVKMLRGLARFAARNRESFIAELKKFDGLDGFRAKVELLELIDRASWKRIGKVNEYPDAYRIEEGEKIRSPFVAIEIDEKRNQFGDAKTVADALDAVNKLLGNEAAGKVMAFEIRKDRTTHQYSINKTGDKEYRVLKEFATLTEARDFMRNNNADLVAAWDGVKDRHNVKKTDVRNAENRPRTGADHRKGKDVTPEMFVDTLGFRGVEFGSWVGQGANAKERQGMLNAAFDSLVDLASIIGVPPKAISLNGTLGLAFGSRGKGNAAAHFEPGNLVINLTKTKGAGTLAHEWFHALDNYFARERGGEVKIAKGLNPQQTYREQNFITYRPEPLYVHKTKHRGAPISKAKLEHYGKNAGPEGYYHPSNWQIDPSHPTGVRPVVEAAFADLVKVLDESPMSKRASANDKTADGYWGRIIERGARAFENFTISKMQEQGYSNDYLANVTEPSNFPRSADRYPYLLPEEMAPVREAFDRLFSTLDTRQDDAGNVALFSRVRGATRDGVFLDRGAVQKAAVGAVGDAANRFVYTSYLGLPADVKKSAKAMEIPPQEVRAVHWNGTTYLVDGRFKSAEDVERAVFHEHYAHFGLRAKYGTALGPQLRKLLEGVGGLEGVRSLAEQQGIDLSAYEDALAKDKEITEQQKPLVLMDELLAHVAESTGTLKRLLQEYVGIIRAWLRKAGYKRVAELGITDLAAELRGARQAAQQASAAQGDKDVRFSFVGFNAKTADTYALSEAIERLEKGESANRVRLETGWFKGADALWRFEIADDEAGLRETSKSFDDVLAGLDANLTFSESDGLIQAFYKEGSANEIVGLGKTKDQAKRNLSFHLETDFNKSNFDIAKAKPGDWHTLERILDHPKLFAAYPDLRYLQVEFVKGSDSWGAYFRNRDMIELELLDNSEQILSVLLHEVQHAIQHREGFAMGGNSERNFTDAVKGAVQRMKQTTREQAAMWRITNQSAIKAAEQAAETARYGLLFESATRLLDHSRRDKPSGVFRNIRNEMQWLYDPMFRGNEKARDLQYAFYEIPKPHNMDKRNAFLSQMAFDAGQFFMEQVPADLRAQFKADTRTMKGMLNALQREATKKRKELRPLDELNASERAAQSVYESTEYATSYDIYRALAGEAEARNTQARQMLNDEDRRAQSPASTMDIDPAKLIVMFGGMDVRAPTSMASQAQPETIYIGSMFGDGTTRVLKNPTRNQALAFAKAAKHESMRGIVDPATGDLYLADSFAVDHKMLAEGVGLAWEDIRYSTDPETGSSNRLSIPANSVEFYPRPIFSGDQKSQSALYRLTDATTKGIPLFSARAIAKKVTAATGLNATVVNNESELPADLQAQIKRDKAAGRVAGVYHNGTAYLVAANLRDTQHAISVMLHEAIGHGGVKSVLGERIGKVMAAIYRDMPTAMRNELERRYAGQMARMSEADAQVMIAEEYVAHLAETDPRHSIIGRLVALLRQFIRDTFGKSAALKWSRNDLVLLLAEARAAARNDGRGPNGSSRYRETTAADARGALLEVSEADESAFVASLKGDAATRSFASAMYKARGTESPFFKAWFGKSRMIDKQGQPVAFVHRSYGERDTFTDADLGKNTGTPTAALGHYLARKDVGNVERYGPVVEQFYIRMEKPKVVTQAQFEAMGDWSLAKVQAYRKTLMEQGHDGLYIQGLAWPVVFEGKNIKARRNQGTFDESASTRYSLAQTATAAFKRWFGDSKVVDTDGKPLVVYHGTNGDFSVFDPSKLGAATGAESAKMGFFFASSPSVASSYAETSSAYNDGIVGALNRFTNGWYERVNEVVSRKIFGRGANSEGGNVMPVFLSVQNPLEVDQGGKQYREQTYFDIIKKAYDQGHDGVIIRNTFDEGFESGGDGATDIYVVFKPPQIKSAIGNSGEFDGSNPDIRYSLNDEAATTEALRKLGLGGSDADGIIQQIRSMTLGGLKAKLGEWSTRSEEGIFNGLAGIKRAEEAVGVTDADSQGYVSARMATGIADVMHGVLHYAAPEWRDGVIAGKTGTRGVLEILGDLGQDNLTPWLAWLGGKRAQMLKAQGRENNLTDADIAELLAMGKGNEALFEKVYQDYAKTNEAVLDLAEGAGLIDKEARAKWATEYYVPFYRQDEAEGIFAAPRTKRGLSHQTAAIKALKGGTLPTNDLLTNMLTGWTKRIDAAMKNKALLEVVDNLKGSEFLSDESPRFQQVLISRSQIAQQIRKDRKALAMAADMLGLPEGSKFLKVANQLMKPENEGFEKLWTKVAPTDPDIIRVQRDGKNEYYRVNDESLLRGLKFIEGSVFNDPITRIGRAFKRLLTTGVTASPDFILRNFIRDAAHAWMINKDGFVLGKDSIKGMRDALREDQDYRDLMFAGGSFQGGYVHGTDPEASAQIIRRALEKKGFTVQQQDGYLGSLVNTPAKAAAMLGKGWQSYRTLGDKVENANRLSTYKAALAAGKSKRQAAFEAKDLMDYSLRGNFAAAQWFTDVVPFLNARLQGLYKLGRAMKDDKTVIAKEVALKGAYIALFSLLLAGINDDDERYQKLMDWDKDMHWHIFLGDQHFRIPKPFELGLIFGTIPERLLHALTGTQDGGDLAKAVANGVFQTLAFNPVPQFYQPIRELQANRNFFRDMPIEDMSDEGKLPEARFDERTSAIGRTLGQVTGPTLGISPKQLDHLVVGYTGTLGGYVLSMSNLVAGSFSDADRPSARAGDLPVVKVIYQGDDVRSTKYQSQFYDMMREADQLHRTVKAYREDGRVDAAERLLESSGDKLKHRAALGMARQQLGAVRKQMDAVYRDTDMSGEAKRAKLEQLQVRANQIAERIVRRAGGDF